MYWILLLLGFCWQTHSHTLWPRRPGGAISSSLAVPQHQGSRSVVYFANWVVYDRWHVPSDLPIEQITHVNYAFANVSVTGEVAMSDPFIDLEKLFPGDTPSTNQTYVFGCVKQFYLLKQKNRNLKVLLSIGGPDFSINFPQVASSAAGRSLFAQTAVRLVQDLGFDGLDINWQRPSDEVDALNFVSLLQETRLQLNNYSDLYNKNQSLLLTASCSAQPDYYNILHVQDMDQYLNFWNLAAYNLSSQANITHHQSNLYPTNSTPGNPWSVDQAVKYYTETGGVENSKIVLGMPLFGKSYANTTGLGAPTYGFGGGSWELGTFDYRVLPQPQATETFDISAGASWSYDSVKGLFVTYDNVQVTKVKARYIMEKGLGGGMWFESSGDGRNESSLITTLVNAFTGGNLTNNTGLESSENLLIYPASKYSNLAIGFT